MVTDQNGKQITLARDGGIWVGDDFYLRAELGRKAIALPLKGEDHADADDIDAILEAIREGTK